MKTAMVVGIVVCLLAPLRAFADALDDQMMGERDAVNRQAPMLVDKSTRLDGAAYVAKGRIFVYSFTNLAHPSTDFSAAQHDRYVALLTDQLVNRACTGAALKGFIEAGVTIKWVYFGNDNRMLAEIIVTKKSCKQAAAGK